MCACVCVHTLTSPIWMCVSSTDCEYDWMISFMWSMWLSSMSWNFCNTGRGWLWHSDAKKIIQSLEVQLTACRQTCIMVSVSLNRHENKKKVKNENAASETSLPYFVPATSCVCLGGLWRSHTYWSSHKVSIILFMRYMDGVQFWLKQ